MSDELDGDALSDRDQSTADAEQSLADLDQTSSDADQTASDHDELASERDQQAADADQALSDRSADAHPDDYARSRQARTQSSLERDVTAQARSEHVQLPAEHEWIATAAGDKIHGYAEEMAASEAAVGGPATSSVAGARLVSNQRPLACEAR